MRGRNVGANTLRLDLAAIRGASDTIAKRCPNFRPSLPLPRCGLLEVERGVRTPVRISDCHACLDCGGPSSDQARLYRVSIQSAAEMADDRKDGDAGCSKCLGVRQVRRREDDATFARIVALAAKKMIVLTGDGAWREGEQLNVRTSQDLMDLLELSEEGMNALRTTPPDPVTDLANVFDRVFVISLRRRVDRLAHVVAMCDSAAWPFRRPVVWEAVDGELAKAPQQWKSGNGAWGCARSHINVLERCLRDGLKSVLIMEDDALIAQDFGEKARGFFEAVPGDWDGVMLGGQHGRADRFPPIPVAGTTKVVRCRNSGRTHCYGLRGEAIGELYRRWVYATEHIDWMASAIQRAMRVYAPVPFLVAQAGGRSDITGRVEPERQWGW